MEIASLMMMSPMIVWGRKREEEYPHQYTVHTCTPRDSTTITDSGKNGGEQKGYEKLQIQMVSKCQSRVLLPESKKRQLHSRLFTLREATSFIFEH